MKILAYNYSCLMADLSEDCAGRVRRFSQSIPDSDIYEITDAEYGRVSRPHVTVKYGIHTSNPGEVASLLNGCDMCGMTFGPITAFDNDDCVVLKFDVFSPALHHLNELVSSSLDCTDSHPEYVPHVTIAYLNHRKDEPRYYEKYFCDIFTGIEVWVDTLRFSTPNGNKYQIPLNGNFQGDMLESACNRISRRIARTMVRGVRT